MGVDEMLPSTAREAAAVVSEPQGPAYCGWYQAGSSSDGQGFAVFVLSNRDHVAIAGHSLRRFRGNMRAIFEVGRVLADVHDHLVAIRRAVHNRLAVHIDLGDLGQGIGAPGRYRRPRLRLFWCFRGNIRL